jgi:acetyl esterase/lipase
MTLHSLGVLIIAVSGMTIISASISRAEDQPIADKPSVVEEFSPGIIRSTWTFKKVGDLEIQADVYRPDDDKLRPVIVWVHGGALIAGNRVKPKQRVSEPLLEAGYVIVSIDYRLAPETKLPGILEDLEDAYAWVHRWGPELFHGKTDRLIVMGGSAGGYLTFTAGFRAKPRPTALVAFWGYGDLSGSWYSEPSEQYMKQKMVSKEEAYGGVSGPELTDGGIRRRDRGRFYLYCRQQGLWPIEVTGFDPKTEDKAYDRFSPVRNVTKDYPPTLMVHGTEDTDVPYEQSVLMVEQFKKHGVPHRLITIPNAGHGIGDGNPKLLDQAYGDVLAFVKKHLPIE